MVDGCLGVVGVNVADRVGGDRVAAEGEHVDHCRSLNSITTHDDRGCPKGTTRACVTRGFSHVHPFTSARARKNGAAHASAASSMRFCCAGSRERGELPSFFSLPDTKYMP